MAFFTEYNRQEAIKMKKLIMTLAFMLLLFAAFIYADSDFAEAKKIIDSNAQCSSLTEGQLEHIGNYYMEQMHPGEQHEIMDKMMGGEGSESLRQMHISIAKRVYCNDVSGASSYGMMGYGMMNAGWMHGYPSIFGYGWLNTILWTLVTLAVLALIIWVVVWVIMRMVLREKAGKIFKRKVKKIKRG